MDDSILNAIKDKFSVIEEILNIKIESNGVKKLNNTIEFNLVATENINEKRDTRICKSIGFNHNIIGMTFPHKGKEYKIVSINPKNRKYKISAVEIKGGKVYSFPTDYVRKQLGGNQYINRVKTLEKLLNNGT